jgi:hypothetical protein
MIEKLIAGALLLAFIGLFVRSIRKPKATIPKRPNSGTTDTENQNGGNKQPISRNDGRKPVQPTQAE